MSTIDTGAMGPKSYDDLEGMLSREERREFARGLRQLADWVQSSPAPVHRYMANSLEMTMYPDWLYVGGEREMYEGDPARLRRAIGGKVEKVHVHDNFELVREFSGNVRVRYVMARTAVCTPKVVGTEVKKLHTFTDAEKAEALKEQMEALSSELDGLRETAEVDVLEYDCGTVLGDDTKAAA